MLQKTILAKVVTPQLKKGKGDRRSGWKGLWESGMPKLQMVWECGGTRPGTKEELHDGTLVFGIMGIERGGGGGKAPRPDIDWEKLV